MPRTGTPGAPFSGPAQTGPDQQQDGLNDSPKIDANELRWLGEEADGKRDVDHVVVWKRVGNRRKLALVPRLGHNAADRVAEFVVRTDNQGEGLRGIKPMSIMWKGREREIFRWKDGIRGGEKEYPDAIFWTQSSFLKFVIPYYARMRSTGNLDDMRRKYFTDLKCLAVMHFHPSIDTAFAPESTFCGFRETATGEFERETTDGKFELMA